MSRLNAKQRKLFLQEMQTLSYACKLNMDSPDNDDSAHKNITAIIRITKLLLDESSIHEFIVFTKDKDMREYYQGIIDNNVSPGAYKKIGYGPNHGKVGPKKKNV